MAGHPGYLLPNSGIIYASRDDALPDLNTTTEESYWVPIDFILDPTSWAGSGWSTALTYHETIIRVEEKGLILITNLPANIRGNFNLHKKPGSGATVEEFTDTLANDWSDFTVVINSTKTLPVGSSNMVVCSDGDQWRLTTIISDAITPLSDTFCGWFPRSGTTTSRNNEGSSVTQVRHKKWFLGQQLWHQC